MKGYVIGRRDLVFGLDLGFRDEGLGLTRAWLRGFGLKDYARSGVGFRTGASNLE